jgi:hypothetical protein
VLNVLKEADKERNKKRKTAHVTAFSVKWNLYLNIYSYSIVQGISCLYKSQKD